MTTVPPTNEPVAAVEADDSTITNPTSNGTTSEPVRGVKRPRTRSADDEDDEDEKGNRERRKIEIKFISDKSRRHITFSKRKAGIMKKAFELSVLTGTQVLLLVVSETGLVYTFTTPKLHPLVTKPEGKNLIQACLNAPEAQGGNENVLDDGQVESPVEAPQHSMAPQPTAPQPHLAAPYGMPPSLTIPNMSAYPPYVAQSPRNQQYMPQTPQSMVQQAQASTAAAAQHPQHSQHPQHPQHPQHHPQGP